jgi:hypothetical protein
MNRLLFSQKWHRWLLTFAALSRVCKYRQFDPFKDLRPWSALALALNSVIIRELAAILGHMLELNKWKNVQLPGYMKKMV